MKRGFEGGRWVAELRSEGIGRFFVAAMLVAWLGGWAVGEFFVFSAILGNAGLWSDGPRVAPAGTPGLALAIGAFLLVWLALWTLGGLLAARELLWLFFGAERIEFDGAGVRHLSRIGPISRAREFPRESISGVSLQRSALLLELSRGVHVLTRFGSREERSRLREEIGRALGLGGAAPALPGEWESEVAPGGTLVLRRKPAARKRNARLALSAVALLAIAALWPVAGAPLLQGRPVLWAGVLVFGPFLALALSGAALLTSFREEFHLRPGSAERRRRLAGRESARSFVPPSLAIEHATDDEGYERYTLWLHGSEGKVAVARAIDQPTAVLPLARWMAQRLQCRLDLPPDLKEERSGGLDDAPPGDAA